MNAIPYGPDRVLFPDIRCREFCDMCRSNLGTYRVRKSDLLGHWGGQVNHAERKLWLGPRAFEYIRDKASAYVNN